MVCFDFLMAAILHNPYSYVTGTVCAQNPTSEHSYIDRIGTTSGVNKERIRLCMMKHFTVKRTFIFSREREREEITSFFHLHLFNSPLNVWVSFNRRVSIHLLQPLIPRVLEIWSVSFPPLHSSSLLLLPPGMPESLSSALRLISHFCRPTADCLFCWTRGKHGGNHSMARDLLLSSSRAPECCASRREGPSHYRKLSVPFTITHTMRKNQK